MVVWTVGEHLGITVLTVWEIFVLITWIIGCIIASIYIDRYTVNTLITDLFGKNNLLRSEKPFNRWLDQSDKGNRREINLFCCIDPLSPQRIFCYSDNPLNIYQYFVNPYPLTTVRVINGIEYRGIIHNTIPNGNTFSLPNGDLTCRINISSLNLFLVERVYDLRHEGLTVQRNNTEISLILRRLQ